MDSGRVRRLNRERIATLEEETRELAQRHIDACGAAGIVLLVVQALRSKEDQARLYAKGRTAPGSVVTNAPPGWSWHNHGRAYDVAVLTDGEPDWGARTKYISAGEIGMGLGLIWGGSVRSMQGDLGHYEYHPGTSIAEFANDGK